MRLQALNDQRGGTAAAVANAGGTDGLVRANEVVDERHDDAASRRSDGVTKRYCAAADVDLAVGNAENLHVRESDGGKRLVDLEQIDVGLSQPSACVRFGQRERRRGGEVNRRLLRVGVASDYGQRLQAQRGSFGARHEQDGGGTVVEGGRVGCGDNAVFFEGGLQGGDFADVDVGVFFIARNGFEVLATESHV